MGTLKPGTTYIYERANGTIYAREFGADPGTKQVIGYDYDPVTGQPIPHQLQEDKLWGEIRCAAQTNPALQEAMDRVKIIYQLSKPDE